MRGKKFALFIILSVFSAYAFAGDVLPAAQASGITATARDNTITAQGTTTTAQGITATAQGAAKEKVLNFYGLTFAKNSAEIPEESYAKLDEAIKIIGDFLDKNEKPFIKIDGYTDIEGTQEYNIKLAEKRADSVMAYVLDKYKGKGLNEKDVAIRGLGPVNFISDNSTEEGRSKNRRIEMVIIGKTMEQKIIIGETEQKKEEPKAEARKELGICWGCIGLDALDVALVAYAAYSVNDQWTTADNYNKSYSMLNNAEGTNYNQLLSMKKTVDDKKIPLVIGTCLAGAALAYTAADYFYLHWVYPTDIKAGINVSGNGVMIFAKEAF